MLDRGHQLPYSMLSTWNIKSTAWTQALNACPKNPKLSGFLQTSTYPINRSHSHAVLCTGVTAHATVCLAFDAFGRSQKNIPGKVVDLQSDRRKCQWKGMTCCKDFSTASISYTIRIICFSVNPMGVSTSQQSSSEGYAKHRCSLARCTT